MFTSASLEGWVFSAFTLKRREAGVFPGRLAKRPSFPEAVSTKSKLTQATEASYKY